MTIKFEDYFDSYANRSPWWLERVADSGDTTPGLSEELAADYERVTAQNYPKIFEALRKECEFRGVEMPACYVDSSGETRLGRALPAYYTLLIDKRSDNMFDPDEMRALIAHEVKHLYQGKITTNKLSIAAEYDSDRAAVSSTSYETIKSYVDKSIHMMIEDKVPTRILQSFIRRVHQAFPGLIANSVMVQIDSSHPAPADRMLAMRYHEILSPKEAEHGLRNAGGR